MQDPKGRGLICHGCDKILHVDFDPFHFTFDKLKEKFWQYGWSFKPDPPESKSYKLFCPYCTPHEGPTVTFTLKCEVPDD